MLEVVEDLAWFQVQIRVVRWLILKFELYVVYSGTVIFLAVLNPIGRASLDSTPYMRLICLDEANNTIANFVVVWHSHG